MHEDACFLIPIRWRHGEISGLQPRYDNSLAATKKKSFSKYKLYSSSWEDTGCSFSGCESIHYAGFDYQSEKTPETVYLTEGILKADICSYLIDRAFLGLLGVNNTSQLPDELKYLKQHGTKRIVIVVDMDYREKDAVKSALLNIEKIVYESELEGVLYKWEENFKGFDDYIIGTGRRVFPF